MRLDASFYAGLERSLSEREVTLFNSLIGQVRPEWIGGLLDALEPGKFIDDANRLCQSIRIWEDEATARLPVGTPAAADQVRPLVRAIGWGDLIVAREKLVGYDAREIAHVENLLPGEAKVREHERRRTVEQVTEIEITRETESERDLQTTDRYEIQSEVQTTVDQEYSIEAGVNTSGRYGLTQVDTSLQAGFTQSKSEARASSQQLAQEIVSRAVERTLERVRELRRLTVTEQIRELNRHKLTNVPAPGATGPAADVSGIYLWLEKLLEVELRNYGTRMLVEFHIPEPALSLLEAGQNDKGPRQPAPFSLSPSDVESGNYMCLARAFGATDLQPPPPQYIDVGYAWASAPSEDVNANAAEDTVADTISIPAGYKPVYGTAILSPHPAKSFYFDAVMAVGGAVVIDWAGSDSPSLRADDETNAPRFEVGEIEFDPAHTWPSGVPVSIRAHGHFDKTLVAQVAIRCVRTQEAMADWRLRTWQQYRQAHQSLMQNFRREAEERALQTTLEGPAFGLPAVENRRIEREELRKWAIKAMRLVPFNFNAVEQVGGLQEIDPLNGDLQATVARLFEEAFEWDQATYFLFPYYWSRRETWRMRREVEATDPRHAAFLGAGAARFIVPVTPGYEGRVLYYLEQDPGTDEIDKLGGPPDPGDISVDGPFEDFWLELLTERRPELAIGSGTLAVQHNSAFADINSDSTWDATDRDVGRELYIAGDVYTIARRISARRIEFTGEFQGADDPTAAYASGSVPYGPPWVVRVPTSLVILLGRRADLASLGT